MPRKKQSIFATIIFLTVCLTLCCCSNTDKKFNDIDMLLNEQEIDSAKTSLQEINTSRLSEKERATYDLLVTKLSYISYEPILSDTVINYSLDFFSKKGPVDKYAEALFYKAVINYDNGNVMDAFTLMKKAEYCSRSITNIDIKHKIYEKLSDWNMSSGEYDLALKYAHTNLKLSNMANNKNWMAYSCAFLSQIYANIDRKDSADWYLEKSIHYIDYIPKNEKIEFYNFLAFNFMRSDMKLSKSYLKKSRRLGANYVTYAINSQIHEAEGNLEETERSIKKSLQLTRTNRERSYVLSLMARMYADNKLFEPAYNSIMKLMDVKDSIVADKKKNDIAGLQKQYDIKMKEKRLKDIIIYAVIFIIFLILINIIVYIYLKNKYNRISKESMENELLINIYNKKIDELKLSNNTKDSEVARLNTKVNELQDKQSKILYEGRNLYEKIMEGKTVVTWRKSDFIHFIEYFKLIDLPFVIHLEQSYDSLSPRYKFFEILYHMGNDDKEVERILGISHNTVRSTRTRIKSKKITE
jgi:hypothetical protein